MEILEIMMVQQANQPTKLLTRIKPNRTKLPLPINKVMLKRHDHPDELLEGIDL